MAKLDAGTAVGAMRRRLAIAHHIAGDHAIVIGASIAGLLAARVLARYFRAVTVLEKDALSGGPVARRGVPQGRHAHVLLQGGQDALEMLFAGTDLDLASIGAVPTDASRDVKWFQFGVWKVRFESGILAHWCDRTRFEHHVRERVADLANVRLLPGHRVTGLMSAGGASEIIGVRVAALGHGESELRADLVVAASGSGSRTPRWLEGLGYRRVREDLVEVDVGYASRVYRRPPHLLHDWTALVIYPKPPESRRAGVLYPLDKERCLVTLIGWVGDHPPGDEAGFLDFARSLPQNDLAACLHGAEPLSPIRRHVFPASRWRRFERMARWPDNFVVVGDAVCGFNPVYGQGMTVSALDAVALARALERPGRARVPGFARRLQGQLAGNRTAPWLLAATSDFRFPEVTGSRPFGLGLLNWYIQGVLELSGEHARAHLRFIKVIGFRASPLALFHPAVALSVLRWGLAPGSSAGRKRALRA
jgi:2-polyprenyl-6-methoxyphenol hydroxylase-like FAD-dependent oxidoreductase